MADQKITREDVDYNPCSFEIRLNNDINNLCDCIPKSPLFSWLNANIVKAYPGEVELEFIVTPKLINPAGVLHGGIQCMVLDEVVGMTGASLEMDKFLYAIDLKVDYIRKAKLGQTLSVKGKIIKLGRNIVNCTAEIFSKDCKLIAQAKSNLIIP
ncbi:MAG: PaaI family thioesterase [Promethearchaeota archaeon]